MLTCLKQSKRLSDASDKAERFVRHLEPLQGALEAFCRRGLINASEVEDVLQSAVMQAYRDFHLYVENTNFRAWIFRYVSLEMLNCNRRERKSAGARPDVEPETAESPATVVTEPDHQQLLEAPEVVLEDCEDCLAAALRELRDVERDVLLLWAVGGFKYREVADILEIPVGSVMGCLSRARTVLRQRLAEFGRERGLRSNGGA